MSRSRIASGIELMGLALPAFQVWMVTKMPRRRASPSFTYYWTLRKSHMRIAVASSTGPTGRFLDGMRSIRDSTAEAGLACAYPTAT